MKFAGKVVSAVLAMSVYSGASYAGCWNQCVAWNPVTGACVSSTKVCNVEDPGKAAASLTTDINGAVDQLRANWQHYYGEIPPVLRYTLDRYPITVAVVLLTGSVGYALATASLETLVSNAKNRSQQAQSIYPDAPQWKKDRIVDGEQYMLTVDIGTFNGTDWNAPQAQPLHDRFAGQWATFLDCVQDAQDVTAGQKCYTQLMKNVALAI